jgi:hypothetical protein
MIRMYLRELFKHTINVFSGASLILALVAVFLLPLGSVANAVIITSAAFLSILVASFYVWKDAINKHPKAADLSIEYKSCTFGSKGSQAGIPTSPVAFLMKLDAINYGQEPAVLTGIKVVKFNLNNKLLASQPSNTEALLLDVPHGNNQISYPFTINGSQRIPNLGYRISVAFVRRMEPIEFARNLGEFQNYEIELEYSFEDMMRKVNSHTISIQGSFEEYRKRQIKEWSSNDQLHGLALEALKASGIID